MKWSCIGSQGSQTWDHSGTPNTPSDQNEFIPYQQGKEHGREIKQGDMKMNGGKGYPWREGRECDVERARVRVTRKDVEQLPIPCRESKQTSLFWKGSQEDQVIGGATVKDNQATLHCNSGLYTCPHKGSMTGKKLTCTKTVSWWDRKVVTAGLQRSATGWQFPVARRKQCSNQNHWGHSSKKYHPSPQVRET